MTVPGDMDAPRITPATAATRGTVRKTAASMRRPLDTVRGFWKTFIGHLRADHAAPRT